MCLHSNVTGCIYMLVPLASGLSWGVVVGVVGHGCDQTDVEVLITQDDNSYVLSWCMVYVSCIVI